MKTTMVPAQITTVEDKIAGNLSLQQLVLLAAPLFIGSAFYIALPPVLHMTSIKTVLSIFTLVVCCTLAIRLKGKILLVWGIVLVRYNLRPRFYVFNKNDGHLRTRLPDLVVEKDAEVTREKRELPRLSLSTPELVYVEGVVADPRSKLSFKTGRKGGLRVHITEIK